MRAIPFPSWSILGVTAWAIAFSTGLESAASAQAVGAEPAVAATLRADAVQIQPGGTTVVRASARVVPTFRALADRIFSWNVDLLVVNPEVLVAEPASLVRTRSDLDPLVGSPGVPDGAQIRGVRDTFLNLEGAGVGEAVELFSVTVRAVGPGTCVLRLRAGTFGVEEGPDFLVLPLGEEDPWSGGDYSGAVLTVTVAGGGTAQPPQLRAVPGVNGGVRIEVEGEAGSTVGLEESEEIGGGGVWKPLAQSPAGAGVLRLDVTPGSPRRFYRGVRLP